ncbi:MAG: hemolysin family protein [Lachnospiraceae bacterium]
MDPSVAIKILVLLLLIMFSAFFSSAETALTTVNKIRLKTLSDEGSKQAKRVLQVTEDSGKMLSAILIGNNLVNISASAIATVLATDLWGSVGVGFATGIITIVVLIFGEISPKTLATLHAEPLALAYSGVISVLMKLLTPVIFVINKLALSFLTLFHINSSSTSDALTENEIRTIVNVSHENGEIQTDAHNLINNMFDFRESLAKEIMVPRIDMTFVNINVTYHELLDIFQEDKFTRMPVYEETTDNVVGILNMKDLLLIQDYEHFNLRDLMREPFFTYEYKNTAELFIKMREESISMAIVLDEYGDTAGLITLEDLIEEIVGEIHDEYDADEEEEITRLNDLEYIILGSVDLDDVNELVDVELTSEDFDSIGGFVFGLIDHLPICSEEVTTENGIYFKVLSMDKNRIEKLYMRIPEPLQSPDEAEN